MKSEPAPVTLDVQRAFNEGSAPTEAEFLGWAIAAVTAADTDRARGICHVSIRLVDETEARDINARYRDSDKATNVLSFPSELPEAVRRDLREQSGSYLLGDLLICVPLVNSEAQEQGKANRHHWAHLVVHGVLHLMGFDHDEHEQAEVMEALEVDILSTLNIPDPYRPA